MKIKLVRKIMADNDARARRNRGLFADSRVLCVNVLSGPGAGKTAILEKTIPALREQFALHSAVIEGDVEGDLDGARLDALGVPVVQLNTSGACHLDATMIASALEELDLAGTQVLFIENVGNLVCPAGFDLGEDLRAVVLSIPEGDDKPIKYPAMFKKATVLLINKCDLAPHLDFSIDRVHRACKRLNPELVTFELSARTGEGVAEWVAFLAEKYRLKAEQDRRTGAGAGGNKEQSR